MSNHKIIIVRHGESEEDKDPSVKSGVDDPAFLTLLGRTQVKEKALELLSEYDGFETYLAYHSPSIRVVQSKAIFLHHLRLQRPVKVVEESSIRNLDWGQTNSENVKMVEEERYRAGVLNFQFPGGDNTPIYVQDIGHFCSNLLAQMSQLSSVCTTIFTHGFALRVIVKHLLGMSDHDFRYLSNPKNCFACILEVDYSSGAPQLQIRTPLPRIKFSID